MKGNIYGLDMKLTPWSPDAPSIIEINGSGFGTDFFKYFQGLSYYRTFAKTMNAQAQGKPIFIQMYGQKGNADDLARIIQKNSGNSYVAEAELVNTDLKKIFGDRFYFRPEMFRDYADYISHIVDKANDPEHLFYVHGAQLENVEMYAFKSLKFSPNSIEFTLADDRKMGMPVKNIGMILSAYYVAQAPLEHKDLFLSSSLVEGITDNKCFSFLIDRFSGTEEKIREHDGKYFWLPNLIFGFGLQESEQKIQLYENFEYLVRKSAGFSGGVGVEILSNEAAFSSIRSHAHQYSKQELIEFSSNIIALVNHGVPLEKLLTVYQPFIPSKPIRNEITNKDHDGCARVVVYSPPEGNPIVLDMQWRLAPKPLDSTSLCLEDVFRANLSRGAIAQKVTDEEFEIMSKAATAYITQFETDLADTKHTIKELFRPQGAHSSWRIPQDSMGVFRHVYWINALSDTFENQFGSETQSFRQMLNANQKRNQVYLASGVMSTKVMPESFDLFFKL